MTKKITTESVNLNESLKKLAGIVSWFENQNEVDVEKALQYVKEGVDLIKTSKDRLKEIENEFIEIKKSLNAKES
jgi:exonuclease VII small subunit